MCVWGLMETRSVKVVLPVLPFSRHQATGFRRRRCGGVPPPSAMPSPKWTNEEDEALVNVMKDLGTISSWNAVGEQMRARDGRQCRDRYHKVIKRSATWKRAITQIKLPRHGGFRRNDEKEEHSLQELGDLPLDEMVHDLLVAIPEAAQQSYDTFSFEHMYALGALPHLSQPVPNTLPSPDSMKALPTWEPPQAPAITIAPAATLAPADLQESRPGGFYPKTVPVNGCCKGGSPARLRVQIKPNYQPEPRSQSWQGSEVIERSLHRLNCNVNIGNSKSAAEHCALKKQISKKQEKSTVMFNWKIVRQAK